MKAQRLLAWRRRARRRPLCSRNDLASLGEDDATDPGARARTSSVKRSEPALVSDWSVTRFVPAYKTFPAAERRPDGRPERSASHQLASRTGSPPMMTPDARAIAWAWSTETISRPKGSSDTGISLKFARPRGMPMTVRQRRMPVRRWPSASHQPHSRSQRMFPSAEATPASARLTTIRPNGHSALEEHVQTGRADAQIVSAQPERALPSWHGCCAQNRHRSAR